MKGTMDINAPLVTLALGDKINITGTLVSMCKYGENPHQSPAGLFDFGTPDPLALSKFETAHEAMTPSLINFTDLDRLIDTHVYAAAGFEENGWEMPFLAFGVKHGNCAGGSDEEESEIVGASESTGVTASKRTERMMRGDLTAIFGGLVMTNFPITLEDAEGLALTKLDGVIAPRFDDGVFTKLERLHGKCRFLKNSALAELGKHSIDITPNFKKVRGGLLAQPTSRFVLNLDSPGVKVYGPPLTLQQKKDIILAWAIGSTSNSNTITIVKDGQLLGNGVGQQDRYLAAKLALLRADRAEHWVLGAIAYSDSFFPYPDGVAVLIKAGIKVIFASSGSRNDHLTIDLCKQHGVTLVMVDDKECRGFARH
jgi:phosphoribosylaminoimidazolecarboxamide formyltransferase/IMP cyclohydrolase